MGVHVDISKLPAAILELNADKFASFAVARVKREKVHEEHATRKGKRIPLTERMFYSSRLSYLGRFEEFHEAIVYKLNGGSRYTPDFYYFDSEINKYVAVEVKGTFKLKSHNRALTAFKEAAAKFINTVFLWYEVDTKTKNCKLKLNLNTDNSQEYNND